MIKKPLARTPAAHALFVAERELADATRLFNSAVSKKEFGKADKYDARRLAAMKAIETANIAIAAAKAAAKPAPVAANSIDHGDRVRNRAEDRTTAAVFGSRGMGQLAQALQTVGIAKPKMGQAVVRDARGHFGPAFHKARKAA